MYTQLITSTYYNDAENINYIVLFVPCLGFAVAQWLGIRLQMLGVAMVAGVSFIAVLEHHFNTVNPGKTANKSLWTILILLSIQIQQ